MPYNSMKRRSIPFVLLIAAVLSSGCDPRTESRITNSATGAIEVALMMDRASCGTGSVAHDWFQEVGFNESVEVLAIDSTRLTGRYRLTPSSFMVVHQSLGREPFWCFDELRITKDDYTAVFSGTEAITEQFSRGEGYRYLFEITDTSFAEAAATFDMATEHLGRLRLGLSERQVNTVMKAEPEKGDVELWGATGEYGQTWFYPSQGIFVDVMSSAADGSKTVGSLAIQAPSTLTTQRGIGIGSSHADVLRVYGAFRAPEYESWPNGEDSFVAGSIYGGLVFTFTEGAVSEIFLGAAAE
jgi:hypothetical protein